MRLCTFAIFFALFAGCAAPLQTPPLRVQTESAELAREAAAAFPANDADGESAQVLHLRESISADIESFDGDGTISAHKMRYALIFRLDDDAPQEVALEQVVPVSESRYLASRRVREDAIVRLRRDALRQMRYILSRENP